MRKKRLVKAQQLQTVAPFSADSADFNEYPTDVYTDYSNFAWVSPVEAQKIIDVFGNSHILEGSKSGTFYVNPLYLSPEVETLLWRSRGAKRFEGDDKGTYASAKRLKKNAGAISLRNHMKEAVRLLNTPPVNLTEVSSKLKQMLQDTINGQIKSLANKIIQHIDLENNPSDQYIRTQMKLLNQLVFTDRM